MITGNNTINEAPISVITSEQRVLTEWRAAKVSEGVRGARQWCDADEEANADAAMGNADFFNVGSNANGDYGAY